MTVKDVMTILESPDKVRIFRNDEEIYNEYFAQMRADEKLIKQIGDTEVKRCRLIPEIRHKRWKELGLNAPLKPEETPDYSFSDLQLCIYYTIII